MTPGARYAAAIDILDEIQGGVAAEKALTTWGRQNRYAGSKDRAAVRDHVYDVLRCKLSCAALGGGTTGRALVLGLLRQSDVDPANVFNGAGYGPEELSAEEATFEAAPLTEVETLDLPDWILPKWRAALGKNAEAAAQFQRSRAPVTLRVNRRKSDRNHAQQQLALEDIQTRAHPSACDALIVTKNPRRISGSKPYQDGLVELQDASSQMAVAQWPLAAGQRVLDYCAGGGGKALAMAANADVSVFAHDISPARMRDLPARAARAGVQISLVDADALKKERPFDLVLVDAPCSGSGTWRRTPDAKWKLTQEGLEAYHDSQTSALTGAALLVATGGTLIYATCSVFRDENEAIVDMFASAHDDFSVEVQSLNVPVEDADGFYYCVLKKH